MSHAIKQKNFIIREGYTRHAYDRKAYVKADGTHVAATHVPKTYVPPTKIHKIGKPGPKGQKLIPIKDTKHSLGKFGYRVHEPVGERREALEKAVKAYGPTKVQQRLNALANLERYSVPPNSEKFTRDRQFVKTHLNARTMK